MKNLIKMLVVAMVLSLVASNARAMCFGDSCHGLDGRGGTGYSDSMPLASIYYYENNQKIALTQKALQVMTVPQFKELGQKLIESAKMIQAEDPTPDKSLLFEYIVENCAVIEGLLTGKIAYARKIRHRTKSGTDVSIPPSLSTINNPAMDSGNLNDVFAKTREVITHNQTAAEGRQALEQTKIELMKTYKPEADYCTFFSCDYGHT